MNVPAALLSFFQRPRRCLILGHEEPDGDCLASQRAVAFLVESLGGKAVLASPGPFVRPEILAWEPLFLRDPSGLEAPPEAAIVLDCSRAERLGSWQGLVSQVPEVVVIDHHSSGETFGKVCYVDPTAPSTTLLVWRLLEALGCTPSLEIAEALLLGTCSDTGFFRHLEEGQGEVLRMCARLSDLGASLKRTWRLMSGGQKPENLRLLGLVLQRLELWMDGKVAYSFEEDSDRTLLHADGRPNDILYQLLFGIETVEAVVVLRPEQGGTVGALRSRSWLDCGRLAGEFQGGGHARAAGFFVHLGPEEVKRQLRARLQELIP